MTDDPAFAELLGMLPVADAVRAELRARLAEPDRHYHGTGHVALLWRRHRAFGAGLPVAAPPWDLRIACAIAFHDAIYDATRQDNEARSAALWRDAGPAMDTEGLDWVAATIEATSDHLGAAPEPGMDAAAWQARAWMLDLDLTPIGEAPEVFDASTALLRAEFAHVPQPDWDRGRAAFLGRLAAAPALYRSPVLRAAFEDAARANLARALGRL